MDCKYAVRTGLLIVCLTLPAAVFPAVFDVGSEAEIQAAFNSATANGEDDTVNADFPAQVRYGITLVGKRAYVPEGTRVGRNCVIFPLTLGGEYSGAEVTAGSTIGAR